MNIQNSVFRAYDSQNNANGVEVTKGNQTAPLKDGAALLSQLREGQVFSGQITNILNHDITILLENNRFFNGKMKELPDFNIGDRILFEVKENTGNQVTIQPLKGGELDSMFKTIEKALDANGFSITEKNVNLVKTLMDTGQPLDKAYMQKIMQQSLQFPEANVKDFIRLNQLGIPVTKENVAQYIKYTGYEHSLNQEMMELADSLVKDLAAFANENHVPEGAVKNLFSEVINSFELQEAEHKPVEQNEMTLQKETDVLKGGETQKETNILENPVTASQVFSHEGQVKLYEALTKELDMNPRQALKLIKDGKDSEGIVLKLLEHTQTNQVAGDSFVKSLFKNEEFQKLFSDVIKKQWSLEPEKMKDAKEIDSLFDKIYRQTGKLLNAFEGSDGFFQETGGHAKNMQDNLSFIHQLNQSFMYTQVPLKLQENGSVNSELFIYANKEKLAKQKGEVSVLLHLDMEHLGATDVHVSLVADKVYAKFYLQDNQAVSIVKNNMGELVEALKNKGFSLSNEVIMRAEEKKNMVVEEIVDDDAERSVKRYTFDMRT